MQVHIALKFFLLYIAFQKSHAVCCFFDSHKQHFFFLIGGLEQNLLQESKKLSEMQDENECFSTGQPQNIFNN